MTDGFASVTPIYIRAFLYIICGKVGGEVKA